MTRSGKTVTVTSAVAVWRAAESQLRIHLRMGYVPPRGRKPAINNIWLSHNFIPRS